jgi:hypothetical protein
MKTHIKAIITLTIAIYLIGVKIIDHTIDGNHIREALIS